MNRHLRTIALGATLAALAVAGGAPVHAGGGSIPWPKSYSTPPHAGEGHYCTQRQLERARFLVVNGGTVLHRPAADSCLVRVAQRKAINRLDGAAEPFARQFNDDLFAGAESFDRECVVGVFWNHENQWLRPLKSYWVEGGPCPS